MCFLSSFGFSSSSEVEWHTLRHIGRLSKAKWNGAICIYKTNGCRTSTALQFRENLMSDEEKACQVQMNAKQLSQMIWDSHDDPDSNLGAMVSHRRSVTDPHSKPASMVNLHIPVMEGSQQVSGASLSKLVTTAVPPQPLAYGASIISSGQRGLARSSVYGGRDSIYPS